MPRSDYGKMLRGHGPCAYSLLALGFIGILGKCGTVKSFRSGPYFGKGAKQPDITLRASPVPSILLARLRDNEGTYHYRVAVGDHSSLGACCKEVAQRVKEWKPDIAVRLDENIFPQRENALPIPKDISQMESDHNQLEERDGFPDISSNSMSWTSETALIYTIIEDVATSDDKRVRLYEGYAEVMEVHGILRERCGMTYRQIANALALLAESGILVPIGRGRNAARRLRFVDHVPDFTLQQQEVTEQHDAVLPLAGEHTAVEQPKRLLQDNSAPMGATTTLSDRNFLAQCIAAIRHGVSHILKIRALVQMMGRRYKKGGLP